MSAKTKFKYYFRIPGWCGKYSISLNGITMGQTCVIEDGYALIDREWSDGDKITLVFDMPVNFVRSNPHVRENTGKIAVMRGPVVYCAEEEDNGRELFRLHAGKGLGLRCLVPDYRNGSRGRSSSGRQKNRTYSLLRLGQPKNRGNDGLDESTTSP